MSLREEVVEAPAAPRTLINLESQLTRLLYLDAEKIAYGLIFILAIISRFWDLGARVMSHDESLHVRYSWNLYQGEGFQHTPLMHGPLLFHMTALSYLLFGANDFTGRIYAAVVGIIIVMLPYFMRRWLGKLGALAASVMLLISPMILYYSRYIREDMPAILGALLMVLGIWHYIEDRKFRHLLWLTFGFALLYASKEVSFIYVAIFGSFLTIYLITRLLEAPWESSTWRSVFFIGTMAALLLAMVMVGLVAYQNTNESIQIGVTASTPASQTDSPALAPLPNVNPTLQPVPPQGGIVVPVRTALIVVGALTGTAVLIMVIAAAFGQRANLRRFPELDTMIVMGTLILPMLSPFLIHAAGYNSMDESDQGIRTAAAFTIPMVLASVAVGLIWGMTPPQRREESDADERTLDEETADLADEQPGFADWLQALFTSRWIAIGALFWVFFMFFFTTMFTNGNGVGTGIVASLGYWLEQQEVKRGNQPWYYYILVLIPIYEFLPGILSLAAGAIGLRSLFRRVRAQDSDESALAVDQTDPDAIPAPSRRTADPVASTAFPVLAFAGYWIVTNIIAYSIAGEKMPWLTTHLTVPMIILGAWVVGRMIEGIEWRRLTLNYAWLVLLLLPVVAIALLRVVAPVCNIGAAEQAAWAAEVQNASRTAVAVEQFQPNGRAIALGALRLPCNTFVPEQFQVPILAGQSLPQLSATYAWLAALLVLAVALGALFYIGRGLSFGQIRRVAALGIVLYLGFLTARFAWMAAYINYDYATEYLVYAHSSRAVKDVLETIEEISLKTTDGYGLRIAYDNRVSWPYVWYFRDYYNAIYYGDQPSRGLLGDAPVVVAGPDNWAKVEPILGDRYYTFEYIRMWWPMQDYFDLDGQDFTNFFVDPDLQRGVWDIFYRREYSTYAAALTDYRATEPSFALSDWPVAERMRLYIRKDVFAQVWDYGVTASEIAAAVDPYTEGVRQLFPTTTFGTGVLNHPHGIDIGPDGLIYVADSGNHRIAVFDANGGLVRTFGVMGLAPAGDVLNEPWDVAVGPDGDVYIADTWNYRVVHYTAEGEYLATWGTRGEGSTEGGQFWGPRGIEVDDLGSVYVSDTGNKRIQVFNADGTYVDQIGFGGAQEGQLDEPAGLEVGPDGLLYVADTWNQRIQVFSPTTGVAVRSWYIDAWFAQTNERPYLDLDANGNVYVTDPEGFRVIVFDGTGRYLYSFGDFTTIGLAGAVAVDEQGNLYVVDAANGTIQRYDLAALGSPVR